MAVEILAPDGRLATHFNAWIDLFLANDYLKTLGPPVSEIDSTPRGVKITSGRSGRQEINPNKMAPARDELPYLRIGVAALRYDRRYQNAIVAHLGISLELFNEGTDYGRLMNTFEIGILAVMYPGTNTGKTIAPELNTDGLEGFDWNPGQGPAGIVTFGDHQHGVFLSTTWTSHIKIPVGIRPTP